MHSIPIPDGLAEQVGGKRCVIGESDPTRDDVRPCEYIVTASEIYPGRPAVTALITLSALEREAIFAGANISLTLDGGELPWSIGLAPKELVP